MRNFLIVVICLSLIFILCSKSGRHQIKTSENNKIHLKNKDVQRNVTPIINKVKIGAIGDILIHNEVYEDAEQPNGSYNFNNMFNVVRKTMQQPDILIANQETMIGGKQYGLSTYPKFNSPYEVGDALKNAGVDFVTLANNHSLDRGEKIIESAISHWNKLNMPYTGAFISKADQDHIRVITKNDIRFSILAYTYGTNGMPVPKGKDYLVNLIDVKKIKEEVEKAKSMSDVIIVAMHWGNEGERYPNNSQIKLAQQLADMGVNIIIGNHPHVLQPPAWVIGKSGNKTFVMYSLGNFLSAQDELYELIGGIASIEVVKTKIKGKIQINLDNPTFMPTYNYYLKNRHFKILPLNQINEKYLKNGSETYKNIKIHMKSYIKEIEFTPQN